MDIKFAPFFKSNFENKFEQLDTPFDTGIQ